ncbi:50S ribosomal protein L9 [Syntrophorhabdus aromaticivorans]|uniref:Large ribosomal subunit protein bL9 n=1 Tax=Syntrophorhabdus aromaticivorans TaxID=328301 RepID=A0A351U7U6_9BACT|nr:50S ribosomal protein L9 [Syntrophorhabdus aromaticivorans]NLW34806.1 50S ribosomal protein L9 [Syntrophorhabdus aromaticivorans]HBA56027.1 50S ribosomal protein L9 [Syntrophorhabdus aromaticivorans]
MKVILTEDVKGTGRKGDVVTVKDGHGRNFLIPRGLALPATEGNITRFENVVKSILNKRGRDLQAAADIKAKLEEISLIIRKKVGVDGKLFGSVTPADIVEAVKNAIAIDVDRKSVRIEEPIKMTGAYSIEIHLDQGIDAAVKIEVEQEQ